MPRNSKSPSGIAAGSKGLDSEAVSVLKNPTSSDADELERLLVQIEDNVMVNDSSESRDKTHPKEKRSDYREDDNVPPSTENNVVDSQQNPTQLYLRINYRLWDMAVKVLHQNPSEASIWIQQSDSGTSISRNLPLHLLCQQGPNPAPVNLVNKLIAAYPQAIRARNSDGDLPIHVACRNPAFRGMEGVSVLMALAEAYPEGMEATSGENGPTSWSILESNSNNSMSPHGATISKMLQVKLGTNRPRSFQPQQSSKFPSPSRSRALPELIANDGSDIASELNRRRLSVLKNQDKPTSEPSSLIKQNVRSSPTASGGQIAKGKESNEEPSNPGSLVVNDNDRITPSAIDSADSSEKRIWQTQKIPIVSDSRKEMLELKQSKSMQEVEHLKRRLDELREENFASQVDRREKEATIEVLRKAVEQEREVCSREVKAAEAQVNILQDQLLVAQEKISSKSKSEQELFQRVMHLESVLAEKKAEMTTMKSSIHELNSSKAMLQQSLQRKKEKVAILQEELLVKNKEIAGLIDKHEQARLEANKLLEVSGETQNRATALERLLEDKDRAIEEREIQLRALTEARRASEKTIQKLEESNNTLRSKSTNLTEILRKSQESFQSKQTNLEGTARSLRSENESLKEKLHEAMSQCDARDMKIENLSAVDKKFEELSTSFDSLRQENSQLREECGRLSDTIVSVEKENFEKDEVILEIERLNAVLQKELDTVRDHHKQLRNSHDDLTKKIIEEQLTLGMQKLSTKNHAYKAELKRLLSENALEIQKSAQQRKKTAALEEKLAVTESRMVQTVAESEKLRRDVDAYKAKCQDLTHELNRIRISQHSHDSIVSGLEKTISTLKGKNQELSERCSELRSIFCAGVEKIEASYAKSPESPRVEIEPLLQTTVSDLQNLVDELREKNQLLQEECDVLRNQIAPHSIASKEKSASKTIALDSITGLAAIYEDLDSIRGQAKRLSRLLNVIYKSIVKVETHSDGYVDASGIAVAGSETKSSRAGQNQFRNKRIEALVVPASERLGPKAKRSVSLHNKNDSKHFGRDPNMPTHDSLENACAITEQAALELVDLLDDLITSLSEHEVFHFRDISHVMESQSVAQHSVHATGFFSELLFTHCENLLTMRHLRDSNAELQLAKHLTQSRLEVLLKEAEEKIENSKAEKDQLECRIKDLEKEIQDGLKAFKVKEESLRSLEETVSGHRIEIASSHEKAGYVSSDEAAWMSGDRNKSNLSTMVMELIESTIIQERSRSELLGFREKLEHEVVDLKASNASLEIEVKELNEKLGQWIRNNEIEHSQNKLLVGKLEEADSKCCEVQKQLEGLTTEITVLRSENGLFVDKNGLLQKEKDELANSLRMSTDKIRNLERVTTNYEKALHELFEQIGHTWNSLNDPTESSCPVSHPSNGSLIDRAKAAAQQLEDMAKSILQMRGENKALTKSVEDQNERMIMLRDQVNDWTATAFELRSKNSELAEKLKKETERQQESQEQLEIISSKNSMLSEEADVLAKQILSHKEECQHFLHEVEKLRGLMSEVNDSVLALLDVSSTPVLNVDKEVGRSSMVDAEGERVVSDELLRNITVLSCWIDAMRNDRASLDTEIEKMNETTIAQEKQIRTLEETILVSCRNDEQSPGAPVDSLELGNQRYCKETDQLRLLHSKLKTFIDNLEQFSAERGMSVAALLSSIGETQECNDDQTHEMPKNERLNSVVLSFICLQQGIQEAAIALVPHQGLKQTDRRDQNTTESGIGEVIFQASTHSESKKTEDSRDDKNGLIEGVPPLFEGEVLNDAAHCTPAGSDDCNNTYVELTAANRTLRLENKLLKSSGRKKEADAIKVEEKLREENKSLKRSIKTLTQQTREHQQRIHQLAKRQAELVRKKQSWTCQKCQERNSTDHIDDSSGLSEGQEALHSSLTEKGGAKPSKGMESRDDELPIS